ncbi:MAG TPA: oligosaccharide flippase family protein [Casimicrobiaceae bacterium]|nr:oligosaccharide flippase family protein [Casimicrobiaceae bacterium]
MLDALRQVALVAVPKIAGGALTLGLNIVLLRIWSPETYGIYALCTTFIVLADAIVGSSLDLATLRLGSEARAGDASKGMALERTALAAKLLASVAALPIVLLGAESLAVALFGDARHGNLLIAAYAASVALLLFRSTLVHAQLGGRFGHYALLEATHSALKFGGIGVLLVVLGEPRVGAVLAFYVAGPAAAFALGLSCLRGGSLWSPLLDFRRLRELLLYVRWYALSGAVGNLLGRLDLFILSALAMTHEVGLFAGAQTFAAVLWLAASYLSIVLSPRIMPMLERGMYRGFHRRVQIALYATSALVLAALLILLDAGLPLFPPSFRESSDLLAILLVGTAVSFATFPLALPLVMFRRPRFTLAVDCAAAPVLVVLYGEAIAAYGAEGAAWVTTASLIARGGIVQVLAWRLSAEPLSAGDATSAGRIDDGARP